MNIAGFAEALAKTPDRSPAQAEKDRAIEVARRVMRGETMTVAGDDLRALSAQLLRALALTV